MEWSSESDTVALPHYHWGGSVFLPYDRPSFNRSKITQFLQLAHDTRIRYGAQLRTMAWPNRATSASCLNFPASSTAARTNVVKLFREIGQMPANDMGTAEGDETIRAFYAKKCQVVEENRN